MEQTSEEKFIYLLQCAYSGELAAFYAYDGHANSVSDAKEKAEIRQIQKDEMDHRECLYQMLNHMNAKPLPSREFVFSIIGKTISFLCYFGGWFIPMYGAGRLESTNIVEYENAARLAVQSGKVQFADDLLKMAEVEWDHEFYFRKKIKGHWLTRIFPMWKIPPSRENIRLQFRKNSPD